jgi:hypothetical protein
MKTGNETGGLATFMATGKHNESSTCEERIGSRGIGEGMRGRIASEIGSGVLGTASGKCWGALAGLAIAFWAFWAFWGVGVAHGASPIDTALYATLLDRHTRSVPETVGTVVDYRTLASDPEWTRLVSDLATANPVTLADRYEKLAFWINVYNILAIETVARSYPVESIRDLGSFFRPVWKKTAGDVGGRNVTLDAVEHRILRPMGEPRIHAAIVCASTSCPSLRREPFVAGRLDAQLDDAMGKFVTDSRKGVRIDRESDTVHLSRIFEWFSEDFTQRGDVLGAIAPYLAPSDRSWLDQHPDVQIRYLDYDWRLNDRAKH